MNTYNRFAALETERRRLQAERGQIRFATAEVEEIAKKASKRARRALKETLRLQFGEEIQAWPNQGTDNQTLSFLASLTEDQRNFYVEQMRAHVAALRQAGVRPEGAKVTPNRQLASLVDEYMERTGEKSRLRAAMEVQNANPHLALEAKAFSEIRSAAE